MPVLTLASISRRRRARRAACVAASLVLGAWCTLGTAFATPVETPVTVERVRPRKQRHPTVRFLRENLDFIRSRLDALRLEARRTGDGARDVDPRFLDYAALLRAVLTAHDSLNVAEDDRRRRDLFAGVDELARLESQLDLMDRLLLEQRTRLGALQRDFTGCQQTALAVVLSGKAPAAGVARVVLTLEDGDTLTVAITPEQRASLERGGILELFHGLVEPREQVVEIALAGEAGPPGSAGFVTLDPARDRLTYLRLDLGPVRPDEGAASLRATTWLHDASLGGRAESEP